MSYGITSAGFVKKPLLVIQSEIRTELINLFGTSINFLPESTFGQLVDIYSEREALIWELMEAVYNSQYLTAEGVSLDLVAAIVGKRRLEATFSKILDFELTFTGAATVPAGSTFSDPNDATKIFSLDADVVATGAGTYTGDLTSTVAGPISANAGTITVIDNPVSGLSSVTNPNDTIEGREEETDQELSTRLFQLPTVSVNSTADAMENAIRQLNNVEGETVQIENAFVIENLELTEDGDGRPGKSIEVVVYQTAGATDRDSEIATVVATSKPQGIKLFSTTGSSYSETINLDGGNTRDVIFSRPTEKTINVIVDLTVDSDYPSDGDTQVSTAIENYINGLNVGGDVIVYGSASIATSIFINVSGILDATIKIAIAPTTPTLSDNITIGTTEIAKTSTSNITVNS